MSTAVYTIRDMRVQCTHITLLIIALSFMLYFSMKLCAGGRTRLMLPTGTNNVVRFERKYYSKGTLSICADFHQN